jgi:hypothetical protein
MVSIEVENWKKKYENKNCTQEIASKQQKLKS